MISRGLNMAAAVAALALAGIGAAGGFVSVLTLVRFCKASMARKQAKMISV